MKKILVVGKNSFYYSKVKNELSNYYNISEISHNQITSNVYPSVKNWDLILIFCRVRDFNFFKTLSLNYIADSFCLVSSRVLDLSLDYRFYSYHSEKLIVEKWFNKLPNSYVVRSGTIEGGSPIFSTIKDFVYNVINPKGKLVTLPLYYESYKTPNIFYKILFSMSYGYLFLRPFDLFYRMKENYVYGYVYAISKQLKTLKI